MKKKFYASLTSLIIVLSAVIGLNFNNMTTSAAGGRDCDNNAIIKCGALTTDELRQKYNANENGDVQAIFAHYGVTSAMVGGSMKVGSVTKSGNVIVDGQTVATGAQSVGRQNINGSSAVSISGKTYYQRPTSVSFRQNSLPAFVFLDANGRYLGAVIQSCGNPVTATPPPVKPPEPPKETPVAACVGIKANRIEKDRYTFDATASASGGATVSSYTFTVDGQTDVVTTTQLRATSKEFTLEPGSHTATVSVKTSVGDKTDSNCKVKVTVPQPEKVVVCNPDTGETIEVDEKDADNYPPVGDKACEDIVVCVRETKEYPKTIKESEYDEAKHSKNAEDCKETPAVIPDTGPAEFIGGSLAVGSLTAGAYYWQASRRKLLDTLLNR